MRDLKITEPRKLEEGARSGAKEGLREERGASLTGWWVGRRAEKQKRGEKESRDRRGGSNRNWEIGRVGGRNRRQLSWVSSVWGGGWGS